MKGTNVYNLSKKISIEIILEFSCIISEGKVKKISIIRFVHVTSRIYGKIKITFL